MVGHRHVYIDIQKAVSDKYICKIGSVLRLRARRGRVKLAHDHDVHEEGRAREAPDVVQSRGRPDRPERVEGERVRGHRREEDGDESGGEPRGDEAEGLRGIWNFILGSGR